MKKRHIIIISFFVGILLIGIGSGITFAEFNSFRYGGEKNFAGETSVLRFSESVPEDAETVYLNMEGYGFDRIEVEEDSSIDKNEFVIEVECNEKYVTPFVEKKEDFPNIVFSLLCNYHVTDNDEISDFFKIKGEVFNDIKNRTVYNYEYEYIQHTTVKASPEMLERLVINN